MTSKKTTYIISALLVVLVLVAGFFGVKLPVPPIPEPLPGVTIEVEAPGVGLESAVGQSIKFDRNVAMAQNLSVTGTSTFTGISTFTAAPVWNAASMTFEGATADAYETTFAITDPASSDKTITFPNSTGTVALNPYGASIEFEGATANDFETTLAVADTTTPDKTVTLPDATGTVMLSTLATNAPDAANAVTGGTNQLIFEGATGAADTYETVITPADPTADNTVTLANASGTVMLSSLATNAADAANAVTGGTNQLIFEGATGGADAFETVITPADPTADNTVTLADVSGTVMLSSLATNGPQAANAVWGASNGLVFEGATGGADAYETTITPTDPTADVTLTLPNETGTVALTSQAVDMTLEADTTGGNAGAKTEYIGLPRIKLVAGGTGTDPGSQTIALVDDTPDGEFAAVDASVTLTADTAIYKHGSKSLKAVWDVGAVATDGFKDAALGANAAWDDMESVGLLVYSTATWAAGDLTLVLTDNGGARTYNIPALATANKWTWLEVDISAGDLSTVSDVAVLMSAAGETALGAFSMYLDIAYTWDDVDQEELGVEIQQDGVLSVVDAAGGTALAELTDYIVHYDTASTDAIVYITNQSANEVVALVAY